MAKESKSQKTTVGRVMHEFAHGELETPAGTKVTSRKQAIAIALHEGGASNQEDGSTNRKNLSKSKARENSGKTGQQKSEGRGHVGAGREGNTKTELMAEARKREIPGRSKMTKPQLEKALNHKG
jgi:hypothetical protein